MRVWTTRCWVVLAILSLVFELWQGPRSIGGGWADSTIGSLRGGRGRSRLTFLAGNEGGSDESPDDSVSPASSSGQGDSKDKDSDKAKDDGSPGAGEGEGDADSDADSDAESGSDGESDSDPKSTDEGDEKSDGNPNAEEKEESERKSGEESDEENSKSKDDPLSLLRAAGVAFAVPMCGRSHCLDLATKLSDLTEGDTLERPPRWV